MQSSRVVHVVSCHAQGEVGDVIVGGVAPPPGDSLWQQSRYIAEDGALRDFVLNEPRGGIFRHVNLLVPPIDERAQQGFIIMEPVDTPPMSGSNAMCVATVLLDTGILPMHEPETEVVLEAPGGLVRARAHCKNGRTERVEITNVESFVHSLDTKIEVAGVGTVTADVAYGGDSFVIVDAPTLGISIVPSEARSIAELGMRITRAANEQIDFSHPTNPDWRHISFCQFTNPVTRDGNTLIGTNTVVINPGKLDRSPCGTGCSARMAVLSARGQLAPRERFVGRSIIGSEFACSIEKLSRIGDFDAVVPNVGGRAFITGIHQHLLQADDPWPSGYRLADTWPMVKPL